MAQTSKGAVACSCVDDLEQTQTIPVHGHNIHSLEGTSQRTNDLSERVMDSTAVTNPFRKKDGHAGCVDPSHCKIATGVHRPSLI